MKGLVATVSERKGRSNTDTGHGIKTTLVWDDGYRWMTTNEATDAHFGLRILDRAADLVHCLKDHSDTGT